MPKGIVLKPFRDKDTKKVFNPEEVYEHKSEARFEELAELGYIGEAAEEEKKASKKDDKKSDK
jgi:hypothetical protein